jgi:hypothetical protein
MVCCSFGFSGRITSGLRDMASNSGQSPPPHTPQGTDDYPAHPKDITDTFQTSSGQQCYASPHCSCNFTVISEHRAEFGTLGQPLAASRFLLRTLISMISTGATALSARVL